MLRVIRLLKLKFDVHLTVFSLTLGV